jgi:hypothetical protein
MPVPVRIILEGGWWLSEFRIPNSEFANVAVAVR